MIVDDEDVVTDADVGELVGIELFARARHGVADSS